MTVLDYLVCMVLLSFALHQWHPGLSAKHEIKAIEVEMMKYESKRIEYMI